MKMKKLSVRRWPRHHAIWWHMWLLKWTVFRVEMNKIASLEEVVQLF
jgi:hypothetical protein